MKIILSILMLFTAVAVFAEAEEVNIDSTYFHPAASLYIQGDLSSASNLVANGLSTYPDNGKLKRLKELIEQQQEQEDQQNDDQNQDQQDQDQENQDEQQDQDNQDQQNDENQDQEEEPEDQDEENEDEQDQDPQQQDQEQQQAPPKAEQMSEDEAERLLDAMKQDEKNKRLNLHPVMGAPVQVDKDW